MGFANILSHTMCLGHAGEAILTCNLNFLISTCNSQRLKSPFCFLQCANSCLLYWLPQSHSMY